MSLVVTILFIAGIAQGLFLTVVLFRASGPAPKARRLLGVLTLVLAAMIGEEFIDHMGLYETLPHALLVTFPLPLIIGPLLYAYARTTTGTQPLSRRNVALHALPFVLVILGFLPFYLQPGGAKLLSLSQGYWETAIHALTIGKGLHVLGYEVFTVFFCTRTLAQNSSPMEDQHLRWFRGVLVVTLVPVLLIHLLHFFPLTGQSWVLDSDVMGSLIIAAIIYTFAFRVIHDPVLLAYPRPDVPSGPKYQTSPLADGQKLQHLGALQAFMETEEPFRDPALNPQQLADALALAPHHLSQIINESLGVNFATFVNGYRVEAVKVLMEDPAHAHKTLLALGLEAGFNSKTSFNRVFKQQTGLTPSQYQKSCAEPA